MNKEEIKHVNLYGEYVAYEVAKGNQFQKFEEWLSGDGINKTGNIPNLEAIKSILINNGYTIATDRPIDYVRQIRTIGGTIINVYQTGKFLVQGKDQEAIKQLIK